MLDVPRRSADLFPCLKYSLLTCEQNKDYTITYKRGFLQYPILERLVRSWVVGEKLNIKSYQYVAGRAFTWLAHLLTCSMNGQSAKMLYPLFLHRLTGV